MEVVIGVVALFVAVVSVGVAFWQGSISREQLRLARETEGETRRTLESIKGETAETRRIAQDIKNNIDERITKILDSKLTAESNSQAMSAQFMSKLLEGLGQQPKGSE